jgi:predicted Fe-S protein YdhL (DUF1289 family)
MGKDFNIACIKVCAAHWGRGWCFGCGRTGAEITHWFRYTDAEREAVLAALPGRLAALGLPPGGSREASQRLAREQRLAAAPGTAG